MAELMPQATLEVIEKAGHLPPLEQPDATRTAVLDWLA
jgi:pimeloyl-ACP methyl ester carboxylesterase